ncbi:glucan biosynthesis protein [Paracoccus sp. MC1854]|uniref:glucan biosynthesis protein n=1 Tax=Paracoccus sp. MC1854 TaxID=2760306 RepID=UPI00351C3200
MERRHFMGTMTAALASGVMVPRLGLAQAVPAASEPVPVAFGFEEVARIATDLARAAHVEPPSTLDPPFSDLGYDAYRGIRFRREADPWADIPGFGLDLLPPGMLFTKAVRINLVEGGVVRPLGFDPSVFDFDENTFPPDAAQMPPGNMGWSGFRLRTVLNHPGFLDELAVFQGASYFRVLGRGNRYGLSARGLALGTGSPEGEEFPFFREFWVHTPDPVNQSVTVHALLDSPSVSGAFEFVLTVGDNTMVATRAALVPRRDLMDVGVAPLTSMFWFGPGDRGTFDDYRPAVHDSDGLEMVTGSGQRLWRGLNNPATLQISAFADRDPRGFGLMQRSRDFDDYQDAEAHYELRPSAWIEPAEGWGEGAVVLVEIPLESEFHDNIVSFWKPAQPLLAGVRHDFAYGQRFGATPGDGFPVARVRHTRSGRSVNAQGARSFFIDFDLDLFRDQPDPTAVVSTSAGSVEHPYVVRLPDEGLLRLAFEFRPDRADLAEITARLEGPEGRLSETWLHRWTRG